MLQALSKDPARRYATAEQLAGDLRRYFAKEPVRARGNAAAYRARRIRRAPSRGLELGGPGLPLLIGSLLVLLGQRRDLIAECTGRCRAKPGRDGLDLAGRSFHAA